MTEDIKLWHGDCLELMNDIEKGVTSTENLKEELEKANIEYTTETEEMVLVKEDNVWKIDEYDDLAI